MFARLASAFSKKMNYFCNMNERTIVELPELPRFLSNETPCVLLGSCFSQYMGERMQIHDVPAIYNPLGTLFNPASIDLLLRAMDDEALQTSSVFYAEVDGEWRSWLADTKLKAATPEECAAQVKARLDALRMHLQEAAYLFVTLGTCVCYELQESGAVVTNCHRQPGRLFVERTLNQATCEAMLNRIVQKAHSLNPDIQVVFTVSPYRYKKYTLHGSQLAKATLLLAVDEVCRTHSGCLYFPAYEIVMDELRDYAFYAEDMLHPSAEAADYIWNKLNGTQ